MCEAKIMKYVDSPLPFNGQLKSTSILSKKNYIKSHVDLINNFGLSIDFECKGAPDFKIIITWLTKNLSRKVNYYGHITLYVFLEHVI